MIADIAIAFHWSLADLAEMDHRELKYWHGLATDRLKLLYMRG